MLIKVLDNREVEIIYEEGEGSQNENRITTFNLEVPQDYSDFTKKIVFITEDGNFFDYIENDTYILKNNITKYKKIKVYIWLVKISTNQDFRSKVFDLSFNYNENPSDYVPSEQEQSQWDLMVQQLEELIEEVQALPALKREIVEELPTEDIDLDTIYMVLRSNTEPNNVYDEYIYIEDEWEKIGSTDVDLSQYVKQEDLENYVTNTDYATSSVGGVIKLNDYYGSSKDSNGFLNGKARTLAEYENSSGSLLISKGTLENVLNARIGDISSILQTLDTGSGV